MGSLPAGRIRHRDTFSALRKPGGRAALGPLRVNWIPPGSTDAFPLVGYAVGRRCGNAVVRNRLRRRLREAVRNAPPAPGSYLVIADPGATALSFSQLSSTVVSAMNSAAGGSRR